MLHRLVVLALIFLTTSCGDNNGQATPDARSDAAPPIDGAPDAPPDALPDTPMVTPSELIAAAKATDVGTGLTLPIVDAVVTYLKPQIGSTTNDPAGFTIQASQMGPGLFVSVDPATLTPPLVVGDTVSFTITEVVSVGGQKRAAAITDLTRTAQGFDVTTFSQDVSAATDLVTAIDNYDSELVDVTGTVGEFASSGTGFEEAPLTTTGITGEPLFLVRVPAAFRSSVDLDIGCTISINDTPVGRFNAETQLAAFTSAEVTLTGCPAPTVMEASALSATSVRLTFTRNVLPGSVLADGSQFTFDNSLVASAATVSGRTVTLTTGAQVGGTTYTVTVANTVTDLQGTPLGTPNTATFSGFVTPAIVKINEINAHLGDNSNQCDLIELRVLASGTMDGIQIKERTSVVHTFTALDVVKNDIIVLHFASENTMCNPGSSASETTIDGQPAATFAQNYDTAFDIYTTDSGLVDTDNVVAVLDKLGAYVDAIFFDNDDNSTAGPTETAAAQAVTAMQWEMVGGGVPPTGFADATFTPHAVVNSQATGTTNTGDTLRRVDDTDDNDKDDWAQGAHTWGLINAGQTPIP